MILGGGLDTLKSQYQRELASQAPSQDIVTRQKPEQFGYPELSSASLWKSKKFRAQIRGIAVGDVDGDGKNETVFLSDGKIFIYRYTDKQFSEIREIQGTSQDNFLGVDIADVDKNGKSEIFITNVFQNNNRLNSFVLEWKGSRFEKISDGNNWYYRVLHIPGHENLLLGQKLLKS